MRKIALIGIGAGNPEHITIQAINALQQVNVFFVTDKGADKQELVRLRTEILQRYVKAGNYRLVAIRDPERDRSPVAYQAAVADWHEQRAAIYESLFRSELSEDERGAFLVWGDPSLYDSIIRVVAQIAARGTVQFDYEVIPGISSLQTLMARHRIPLNQVGEPVQITTGRRLSETMATGASDIAVLLDGECAFNRVDSRDTQIYWGAYLGTPQEILLSGPLEEMAATIEHVRTQARARHGWIMDTYLLRRPARRS
jgi:precorrin-6A synthase